MARVNDSDDRLSMLLSSYLDGGLSHDELDEVVEGLADDEAVVAEFRELKEVRSSLRALPMLDLPLSLVPGDHPAEQLSAYLDGELVTSELPLVAAHLDTCLDCRRELAELDKSRTAVRSLPGVEPPAFLDLHRSETIQERGHGRRSALVAMVGVAAVAAAFVLVPLVSSPDLVSVSIADLDVRHIAVSSVLPAATAVQVVNAP